MARAKPIETRQKRSDGSDTISSYLTARGEVRWRIAYWESEATGSDAKIRRFKRGFADRKSAELALTEIQVDIRRGDYQAPARETLNDYADLYLERIRVRASTLAGYRKHYRVHIRPSALGAMRLSAIRKDDLNKFYRQLEASGRKDKNHEGEPLSPATVRHIHTLLSQIFAAAMEDDLLKRNPAKAATPPTKLEAAAPEMQTWSAEESKAFLEWSKDSGDYMHLAWYVLLGTGLRRGELLALRWKDVDFGNCVLHVARSLSHVKEAGVAPVTSFTKPKSGRGRNVDLDPSLAQALQERRSQLAGIQPELSKADSLIFHNRYGRAHNPVQFSKQWRDRVAKAQEVMPDLPTLSVHELRHTHATLLLRAGVHPKIVSERLGHASVSITMEVYSHAIPTLQRGAATAIGALLS
jgi:integrase